MNKGQLVEAVAGQLGSRTAAEDAVDAVLDAMVRAVVAGDRVSVTGFGTLEKVQRSARYARNPQTGERVRVKKTTVPRFRPGQGFKDLVSGTKKLPKEGPSIMKAPKGSLTPGTAAATPAKRTAARKTATTAKTAVAKTAAKKTTTAKTAAKKTTTAKAAVKKTTTAKAVPAKTVTTGAAAKKTATKATAKKTTAMKPATAAKKAAAPARKTAATAKKSAPAKRSTRRAAR